MDQFSVESIVLQGIKRTDITLLNSFFQDLTICNSLDSLNSSLQKKLVTLNQLGIIKDCQVELKPASKYRYNLVLDFKERSFNFNTGTFLSPKLNGLSFGASGTLFNVFGRGEKVLFESSIGQHGKTPLSLTFLKPLNFPDANKLLHFDIFQRSHLKFGKSSGVECKYSIKNGMHQFGYGLIVKNNLLCSSLNYKFEVDTQDDAFLPSRGSLFRNYVEFAGLLGGDSKFVKWSMFGRHSIQLHKLHLSLATTLKCGLLFPINSCISPMDLFSSHSNGFGLVRGRKSHEDSYGNFLLESGIAFYFPIGMQWAKSMKGYLFLNGGCLNDSFHVKNYEWFYGIGVATNVFGNARIEANCGFPLSSRPCNILKSFQLGLGIEYL